ncbi:molybdenum cofactor guanylyltransferase MobA [Pseudotabrizicola algicola]|uniref:Molybdenum cofactor guanylyltransferase n=1 Tax=Pseudotabrizicola algicola TaxID=2709381 RepID=A0A6B3RSY4_9RHOB|nr:molybdenum cofactor guanylyltransferase MobA [Pseudotabrizicola algicola]NEX46189.1 molybdenum cofactor guanylyltransferase MobA [Pseudotabrizicola algicola]
MQPAGHLGVILAGGQARRMGGGDKGLRLLHGQSLLQRVIRRLQPQVRGMAINANGDPRRFEGFKLPVLPDPMPGFPGPLAGVLAAMDWAAERGAPAVVTVAADTPFFPADLVQRLDRAAGAGGFSLAATGGHAAPDWHPTFGLWPTDLRDSLRRDLQAGQRKMIDWALSHGAKAALFPSAGDPFFNINTPDDLASAEARHDL